MSLLFPRVARNLAKAGYYPTDIDTVNACKRLVTPAEDVKPVVHYESTTLILFILLPFLTLCH